MINEGVKVTSSEEDRFLYKSYDSRAEFKVKVIRNGFILKTRSGWYAYQTQSSLLDAVNDYIRVIQKEITQEVKNETTT